MGMVRAFGVAVVLVLAAVSCGDDSGEAGDATTTTAGVEDPVEAYFEALANPDSDQMVVAQQYAAPGSHADGYAVTLGEMYPADGYLRFGLTQWPSVSVTGEAVAECFPDPVDLLGDTEPPPPPSEPAEPGEPYGGERCFDIADTDLDEDGLLTGFTVDGNELTDRLALGGEPVESDGVSFTLIGGYQDGIGTLHVVVQITNDSESGFIHQENRGPYVDPDGKQIDEIGFATTAFLSPPWYPSGNSLDAVTDPGFTDTVIAEFPSAAPGGIFTYGGNLNNTEVTVDIPITLTGN